MRGAWLCAWTLRRRILAFGRRRRSRRGWRGCIRGRGRGLLCRLWGGLWVGVGVVGVGCEGGGEDGEGDAGALRVAGTWGSRELGG